MRCKSLSIYLNGCKVAVSQLRRPDGTSLLDPTKGRRQTVELNAGDVVVIDTPFGPLEMVFDPATALGRKGRDAFDPDRFAAGSSDPVTAKRCYVAASLAAHHADLIEWPSNRYSHELLTHAAATFDNATGRNLLGFDRFGFDVDGVNRRGFDVDGIHAQTRTRFDPSGYDIDNRSVTGLARSQAWFDEILDISPAKERYVAMSPQVFADMDHQWDVAARLMGHIRQAGTPDAVVPAETFAQLANDVMVQALPLVRQELGKTMPHLLRLSDTGVDTAAAVSARLETHRDPDELAFDRAVVAQLITRRLTGRFALDGIDALAINDSAAAQLAATMLGELRTQALLDIKHKR